MLCLGAEGGVFGQAGEGALCFEGLTQQRCSVGLLLLRFAQGDARSTDLLVQFSLALAEFALLPGLLGNQYRQRCEQRIDLGLAGELMPLRRQLLQTGQLQALAVEALPMGLCRLQLLGGAVLRVL
ncbi:hypothetical protein D3C87_1459800 [compost metagenome]